MSRRQWLRVCSAFALALLTVCVVVTGASAAAPAGGLRDKFRTGNTVLIPAGETVTHDLYVTASTVRIDGRIEGDLFVAGGTIEVSGPVTGDLFVAGGTVTINGSVGRHLRVAGGNVTVSGPVQSDLLAGAGVLNVRSDVGGDLIFSAGQMDLGGAVAGGVLGSAQTYTKTGSVRGTEEVRLQQTQPRAARTPTAGSWLLGQFRRYLSIVVIGALMLWLAPQLVELGSMRLRERPLRSLGIGALGAIGFAPLVLAVLIAVVLVAIGLGILGLGRLVVAVVLGGLLGSAALSYLFVFALLFVVAAVVGLTVGRLALERLNQPWAHQRYVALLFGVFVVVAITAIPFIGWLFSAAVALLGLGALIPLLRRPQGAPSASGSDMASLA